jgi:hypothetical protein
MVAGFRTGFRGATSAFLDPSFHKGPMNLGARCGAGPGDHLRPPRDLLPTLLPEARLREDCFSFALFIVMAFGFVVDICSSWSETTKYLKDYSPAVGGMGPTATDPVSSPLEMF